MNINLKVVYTHALTKDNTYEQIFAFACSKNCIVSTKDRNQFSSFSEAINSNAGFQSKTVLFAWKISAELGFFYCLNIWLIKLSLLMIIKYLQVNI